MTQVPNELEAPGFTPEHVRRLDVWVSQLEEIVLVDPSPLTYLGAKDLLRTRTLRDLWGTSVRGLENLPLRQVNTFTEVVDCSRRYLVTELTPAARDGDVEAQIQRASSAPGAIVVTYTWDLRPAAHIRARLAGAHSVYTNMDGLREVFATTPLGRHRLPSPSPDELTQIHPEMTAHPVPQLSSQERVVLAGYLSREPLKVTARRLGISSATARTYLQRVMLKYRSAGHEAATRFDVLALCYEGWGPWLMPPGARPYPA